MFEYTLYKTTSRPKAGRADGVKMGKCVMFSSSLVREHSVFELASDFKNNFINFLTVMDELLTVTHEVMR